MMGEFTDSWRPVFCTFSFMPRLNLPEHRRSMAIRSRWFGSMFAWTLKTKPVTSDSPGATWVSAAPFSTATCFGGGARAPRPLSSSSTPKWRSAEPKKTGVMCPSRKAWGSKVLEAPRISSALSDSSSASDGSRYWEMALPRKGICVSSPISALRT